MSNLFCPYAYNINQTTQESYEYDEDGKVTFRQHILKETRTQIECKKDLCGAWVDGKCEYRGT